MLCDDAIEVFVERCVTVEADGVCDAVLDPHEHDVTRVECRPCRERDVASWKAAHGCAPDGDTVCDRVSREDPGSLVVGDDPQVAVARGYSHVPEGPANDPSSTNDPTAAHGNSPVQSTELGVPGIKVGHGTASPAFLADRAQSPASDSEGGTRYTPDTSMPPGGGLARA